MNPIEIYVKPIDDDEPSFPEMDNSNTVQGHITGVSILENGTMLGKIALGFRVKLLDGTYVLTQLTQGEFEMISGALHGAEGRFNDLKKRRHEP